MRKRPPEKSSSYWRQLLVHPPFLSPLPVGQMSPRYSTKLIRCNFSDRKLYKDVSRAGRSDRSSRLGPLKLKLNFIFPFPQTKEAGREEANLHPEGERGTSQVSSPPLGSPPLLGTVEHTPPSAMGGRQRAGWQLWKNDKEQPAAWNRYIFCFSNATFIQTIRST